MATGIMVAGLVMSAAGTAYGAIQQGAAARQAAAASRITGEYNRQIAEYNATLAMAEADTARELAAQRAAGVRQQAQMHIGAERAHLGAAGVDLLDLDPGDSALLAFEQTAADYALTAELELFGGEQQAVAKENEASLYRSQGQYAQWKGEADAAGYMAQAPSTLGTVLKIGGNTGMSAAYAGNELGWFK